MKYLTVILIMASLMLVACSSTTPNTSAEGFEPIPTKALKIKQMVPVTYEYTAFEDGCSEIEFLKKYVGKSQRTDDGKMQVDNIMDIHRNVTATQKKFFYFSGAKEYICSFWGIAVEYAK